MTTIVDFISLCCYSDGLCIFTATGTAVAIGNKDNNDIHLDSPSGGGTNPKTFPQSKTNSIYTFSFLNYS